MSWHCSTKNTILAVAQAAVSSFEAYEPALEAAGRLNPDVADQLNVYINNTVGTLKNIVTEVQSGDSTLQKVAASLDDLVAGTNAFSGEIPASILATVNLSNIGIQLLLAAVNQQTAVAPAPIMSNVGVPIAPTIVPDKGMLQDMAKRLDAVQTKVNAATVVRD